MSIAEPPAPAKLCIGNFIGGEIREPLSGDRLENYNPATGEVSGFVSDSDADDVAAAVQAAQRAFPAWSRLTHAERARYLERLADLIHRDLDRLAGDETDDNGKPLQLARQLDVPRCETNFRFFAALVQGHTTQAHTMPDGLNITLRRPLGVVCCISPWNLPLYLLTWKVAPALAIGNCVIAKPSELTPLTAHRLAELAIEAGLPPGVLNIVHGTGSRTGQALLEHPDIKAVSFTGGTKTGRHIASVVAPQFKRLSLEMGGKNPNVIFADCDYELMLETTLRSSFANQGQICLCGSRILVEKSIYERFRDDLVRRAQTMRVGDPREPSNQLGAVVSAAHQKKILGYIDLARDEGATVLCGGEAVHPTGRCANGWFVAPTVIEGAGPKCRVNQEEIFGPVVTLQPFQEDEQAVALANDSTYGLTASIWTRDVGRAHRVAEQIEAGVVWVNCWMIRDLRTPFGGVKSSGVGREGGEESLRFFTEPKNVCLKY